jgi:histidine triad (HIT) family protein
VACIFCRIASGDLPGEIVYQDEKVIAIRDINPQAPTHVLIMPKVHISSIADVTDEHGALLARLVYAANLLAKKEGIAEKGYRLVTNCGPHAGQAVPHLHFHLLGGRELGGLG